MALAAVSRMRAEAADFAVTMVFAVDSDAFAAHGDELMASEDAVVGAHFAGALAKEAGVGDVCESYEGVCVGAGERDNGR